MPTSRRRTPLAPSCPAPHACPRDVRLHVLHQAPLFAGLDPAQTAAVETMFVAHGYHEGEPIYREGAPATALYVMATGRGKLTRSTASGEVVVDVLTPGMTFGALPLLGETAYPTTATALTVSCALAVTQDRLERIIRDRPAVAQAALRVVGGQLAQARETITRLSADAAEARLASTLVDLADRVGHVRTDMTLLQIPLTRADLAAMAATTPETVSRVLARWKAANLVMTGRRWVGIVDRDALAELGHGAPPRGLAALRG